jgi:DNA-binding response OmpR family regulator
LGNPAKILIVDDEAYIRRVVELKLKNKGHVVITAANGMEGLEKFKLYKPEIIITDIKMPGMDGQALCQQINNTKNEKPHLIVVVTCSVSGSSFEWLKKMNGTLLEKPFSPSRLLNIIDEFLKNRKSCKSKPE